MRHSHILEPREVHLRLDPARRVLRHADMCRVEPLQNLAVEPCVLAPGPSSTESILSGEYLPLDLCTQPGGANQAEVNIAWRPVRKRDSQKLLKCPVTATGNQNAWRSGVARPSRQPEPRRLELIVLPE